MKCFAIYKLTHRDTMYSSPQFDAPDFETNGKTLTVEQSDAVKSAAIAALCENSYKIEADSAVAPRSRARIRKEFDSDILAVYTTSRAAPLWEKT